MKEFLGTTLGKVVAVLAAVVVFGGVGVALMLGGNDSDKDTQSVGEGEGLVVIEEGEETDEDVIDATDWEDIAGTEANKVDEKRDTDNDGTPDVKDDDDDNDGVVDDKDDDDDNDGTPDKEDSDHPSNVDKEDNKDEDNKDEDNKDENNKDEDKDDDKNNDEVKDPSGESWGPFF